MGLGVRNDRIGEVAADPLERWFEEFLRSAERSARGAPTLRAWLDLAEAWRITRALRDARGNRSAAARALGIGRRTLYAKMEKLGIEPFWSSRDLPHPERAPAGPSGEVGSIALGPSQD